MSSQNIHIWSVKRLTQGGIAASILGRPRTPSASTQKGGFRLLFISLHTALSHLINTRSVSSVGRASDSSPEGRAFKSPSTYHVCTTRVDGDEALSDTPSFLTAGQCKANVLLFDFWVSFLIFEFFAKPSLPRNNPNPKFYLSKPTAKAFLDQRCLPSSEVGSILTYHF